MVGNTTTVDPSTTTNTVTGGIAVVEIIIIVISIAIIICGITDQSISIVITKTRVGIAV